MKRNQTTAFIIFVLLHSSILYYFHDRFWSAATDGQSALTAQRINQGEVLFRDIHDPHPGYIHWLNALSMRIFGEDPVSLRYPVTILIFTGGSLLFWLFFSQSPWLAVIAGLCPAALSFVHHLGPSHHWYALFFTVLIGVILSRPGTEKRREYFIVGVLVATVYLFRQLTGIFVFTAAVSYYLLEASGPRSAKLKIKDILLFYFLSAWILAGMALYLIQATDVFGALVFGVWPVLLAGWMITARSATNTDAGKRLKYFLPGVAAGFLPLLIRQLFQGTLRAWFDDSVLLAFTTYRNEVPWDHNYTVLWQAAWANIFAPQSFVQFVNSLYWILLFSLSAVNGLLLLLYVGRKEIKDTAAIALPLVAAFYAVVAVHFQIPAYLYFTAGLSAAAVLWWIIVWKPNVWVKWGTVGALLFMLAVALYFHAAQPLTRSFADLLSGAKFPAVRAGQDLKGKHLWIDPEDLPEYTRSLRAIFDRKD